MSSVALLMDDLSSGRVLLLARRWLVAAAEAENHNGVRGKEDTQPQKACHLVSLNDCHSQQLGQARVHTGCSSA
jgi:hypothetical protein